MLDLAVRIKALTGSAPEVGAAALRAGLRAGLRGHPGPGARSRQAPGTRGHAPHDPARRDPARHGRGWTPAPRRLTAHGDPRHARGGHRRPRERRRGQRPRRARALGRAGRGAGGLDRLPRERPRPGARTLRARRARGATPHRLPGRHRDRHRRGGGVGPPARRPRRPRHRRRHRGADAHERPPGAARPRRRPAVRAAGLRAGRRRRRALRGARAPRAVAGPAARGRGARRLRPRPRRHCGRRRAPPAMGSQRGADRGCRARLRALERAPGAGATDATSSRRWRGPGGRT